MKRLIGSLLVSSLVAFISISCSDSGFTPTEYDPPGNDDPSYVWTRIATPTTSNLNSLAFIDTLVGICVGENTAVLRTVNGGRTWEELTVEADVNLKDIAGIDRDHFQAVGASQTCSYRLQTGDGGDTWGVNAYCSPAYPDWILNAVSCSDYEHGVMGGLNGLVANFQSSNNYIASGTTNHLYDASYVTGARHYAVGVGGVILQTVNGGASWVTVPSGVTNALIGIDMLPINVGFIVGSDGIILRGDLNSWEPCASGTSNSLLGVSFRGELEGIVVGSFGTVLRTDDGGETWDIEECDTGLNLHDVYYDQSGFGIAVGDSGSVFKRSRKID
jgi:photosystem II stability/assembly factor-like uncharacterized protein